MDFDKIVQSIQEEIKQDVIEIEKIRSELDTLNDTHEMIKKNLQKSDDAKKIELNLLKRSNFSYIELMRTKNLKIKKLSIPTFNYIDEMITHCENKSREFFQLLEKFSGSDEEKVEILLKDAVFTTLIKSIDNQLNVAELSIKGTLDTLMSRYDSQKNK